jgi:succinyl-diaminopimelate desuccinylase
MGSRMLSQIEQQVCERVQTLGNELIDVLSKLVSFNTADPPGENYDECAEFICDYLKELTTRVEIIQMPSRSLSPHPSPGVISSRPNVIAEILGSESGPGLHFNGHYDVVPAIGDWASDPYKPRVEAGRLYGRGSTDMKAGIAAMLVTARVLKSEDVNLKGTISFSFVPDEENDGPAGTKFLTEQKKVKADYCIIGEPSGGYALYNGHKGCLWLEVNTYGKSAHGSTPWKGINAFDEMVEIVQEINARVKPGLLREGIKLDEHAIDKTGAITLGGKVATGYVPNVVPSQCSMTIDRRLASGEDGQKILADFSAILKSLSNRNPDFKADFEVLSKYEACVTPIKSNPVITVKEVLESVTGKTPGVSIMQAGCDMRYFHAMGIPVVVYGPGDLLKAHQVDESVEMNQLITATQVYASTAMRLLGVADRI